MGILDHFKKLNGWQRVWIVCTIFLFLIVGLRPENDQFGEYDFNSDLVLEANNPKCQFVFLKNKEPSINKFDSDCESIKTWMETSSSLSKADKIEHVKSIPHERLVYRIKQLLFWVILSALLYGIGLIARWIRRGGL